MKKWEERLVITLISLIIVLAVSDVLKEIHQRMGGWEMTVITPEGGDVTLLTHGEEIKGRPAKVLGQPALVFPGDKQGTMIYITTSGGVEQYDVPPMVAAWPEMRFQQGTLCFVIESASRCVKPNPPK